MDAQTVAMAEKQAEVCRVFANAKRVMILWSLNGREKSVTDIAQALNCSLQSTSQHLSLMRSVGIVTTRRDGQTIYYRLADDFMADGCWFVLNRAIKDYADCADSMKY